MTPTERNAARGSNLIGHFCKRLILNKGPQFGFSHVSSWIFGAENLFLGGLMIGVSE